MLFRQSLFHSVLERLADEAEEDGTDDKVPIHRISGLTTGFVAEAITPRNGDATWFEDAYLHQMQENPAPEPEEPRMPDHLARLAVDEIACDLDVGPGDSRENLTEKRRRFARNNHPDSVHPNFRENATTRMKIANLLIDEALARLN